MKEPSIDAATVIKIAEHYCHAKAKHPYFCDICLPIWMTPRQLKETISRIIKMLREDIAADIARGELMWDALLNCEVWAVNEAIARGNKAHAVEECYDAIAVLLRVIDVLEGRQELGKPQEGGAE